MPVRDFDDKGRFVVQLYIINDGGKFPAELFSQQDDPAIIDDVKLNHKTPLIIEIPDRHGTGRKPDFITSYVNEAIGLKL